MVQQTQPNVNQVQPTKKQVVQQTAVSQTQKPVVQTAQPAGQMQLEGETPIWKKYWLWLIIAFVVIGAGVGVYFLFF